MKKLVLSLAITSALGLTACDDTTLADVQAEAAQDRAELKAKVTAPKVRVVFDPSAGVLSIPNDLLYSGTTDGTLEIPSEVAERAAGEGIDYTNPQTAIGALDGWGTQNSFTIALEYDDLNRDGSADVQIDATSLLTPGAVSLYQVVKYPSLTDSDCMDSAKAGLLCKGVSQLTFGVDYFVTMSGDSIAIVPLKPFMGGASYVVSLTNKVKDTNGNALLPSSTYASVKADIATAPLVLPSLSDSELNATQAGIRLLQTMVNNFEDVLEADLNANGAEIVYTQAFTVQSAGVEAADPLQVSKLLNGKAFGEKAAKIMAGEAMPNIMAQLTTPVDTDGDGETDTDVPLTVAMALAAQGLIENDPDTLPYRLFNSAKLYGSQIDVPYYLEDGADALTTRYRAACDNGALLAGMTPAQKAAASANEGANHPLCASLGLADFGLDSSRHITKYNPIPEVQSVKTIPVQMTVPDLENANEVRGLLGLDPLPGVPEAGWPVVILQHGITSRKEDFLAATGFLSAMGLATAAIDHPLHGERGFTLENGMVINASSAVAGSNPTHYLNLASLLTGRDNMRQSVSDSLQLRLELNAMIDAATGTPVIDKSNVHYFGHSLGGITGVGFTAVANSPVEIAGDPESSAMLSALYEVKSSVLANPGAGVGNFLVESGSFGPLVRASVIAGLGNELSAAMLAYTEPQAYMAIIAQNPSCAAALNGEGQVVNQNLALICAYNAFMANATDEQIAATNAGFAQFSFAAQTVIDSADPTNYAPLVVANKTPLLMYEMVGDGADNLPDQTVPNSVTTNGLAGTSGLEKTLGLDKVTGVMMADAESTEVIQAIAEFKYGSHSTVLSPSTSLGDNYPMLFAAVNQEALMMAATFFASGGAMVNVSATAQGLCLLENLTACAPASGD